MNDHVVFRNGLGLSSGDVLQSHQYGAKATNWFLAIREHTGVQIGARDYVNVEINPNAQVAPAHSRTHNDDPV